MANKEKTFEEAMAELEAVVDALSRGNLPLDEMIKLYEKGEGLSKHCAKLLEKYDAKLDTLGVKDEG